jgi:uncharacterized alkaline shock family protein YloU
MTTETPQPALRLESPEGRTALGTTRVANEVVAWISALAALQVDGVHAMYQPSGRSIDRILRRPVAHRGARVQLREDQSLDVDVWVVLIAGNNVQQVGSEVQRRIADAIERMLGLAIASVNVHISEVVFS